MPDPYRIRKSKMFRTDYIVVTLVSRGRDTDDTPTGLLRFHSAHSAGQILQNSSNTVGRGLVARLTSARLRAAPPLSNPGILTACKNARIQ